MTEQQRELLKAMHLIKNYCESCKNCDGCYLIYNKSGNRCPFEVIPSEKWNLKPLEEEKDFSVFY